MKKILLFSIFITSWIPFALKAQTIISPSEGPKPKIPVAITFLSTGPNFEQSKALRVGILVEEIYPSIFVQEISYGSTEGEPNIIRSSYFLSGLDVAKKLGVSSLTGLKFVKWNQWNEFEMTNSKVKFRIKFNSKKQFELRVVK